MPAHIPSSPCSRCGASIGDDAVCFTCGAVVDDPVAAVRQETYLGFVIDDVLNSRDPIVALQRWQAKSAARRRLLSASTTEQAPTTEATTTMTAAPVVQRAAPPPPLVEDAPTTRAARATTTTTTTTRPSTSPRPTSPRPVREAPTLTPAQARVQFERRLEIGGWFTGALFAVGGSLWATNLFWDDIPAALRPALVGVGLAAFATAFMAVGAMLAARHRDSLAGHVLGVVGRLIGVSATIPLALLRKDNLPFAIVADVVVMAALWWGLRFAHRKRAVPVDTPSWSGARWFLIGFGIAVVGPTSPWLGIALAIAALLVTRAAIADGTLPALSGQRTWVDDLSVVAVGIAGLVSSVLGSRAGLDRHLYDAVCALAVVAGLEVLLRLAEQRRELYAARGLLRWTVAIISVVVATSGILNVDDTGPVPAIVALLFVAASFYAPQRLSLPPLFRLVGVVASALAAGFASRLLPIDGDVIFITAALVVVFARTDHERRGEPDRGEQIASVLLWSACSLLGLAHSNDGLAIVPALVVMAALWATDRRAERSPLFNLLTVPAALLPLLVVIEQVAPKEAFLVVGSIALATFAIAATVLRRRQPTWPLLALTTATTMWVIGLAGITAAFALDGHAPALIAAVVLTATVFALTELSRHVLTALVGAALAAVVVAEGVHRAVDLDVVTALPLAILIIAAATWLPRTTLATTRTLLSTWSPSGRARHARPLGLLLVGSLGVVVLTVMRVFSMATEPSSLLWTTLTLVVASVLLAVRHRTREQWALVIGTALVAGADIALQLQALSTSNVALMGLGAGIVAAIAAVVVIVARMRSLVTVTTRRLWVRRATTSPRDLWWSVAMAGAVIADVAVLLAAITHHDVGAALLWSTVAAVLFAAHAVLLFAARAEQPVLGLGLFAAICAPLLIAVRALVAGDDVVTLAFVLVAVGFIALLLLAGRWRYHRRDVPAVLEAWPDAATLRRPALAALTILGGAFLVVGQAMHHGLQHLARQYAPGLVVVGIALVGAAYLALRTRRTFAVAVLGLGVIAAVAVGLDGVAHGGGWLPTSFGTSQALVACALVGVSLLLERDTGRRWLRALRLGWSTTVRARLRGLVTAAVPVLALVACLFAVRDAPRAHEVAIVIAGMALVALALAQPTKQTALLAAIGGVVGGGGIGAFVARVVFGSGIAFSEHAMPFVLLGGLLGALAVQTLSSSLWTLPALTAFHARRLRADPALFADVARTMRHAVEHQALALIAAIVAVVVVDPDPVSSSLLSTWLCMGLAVVLTSRMAVDREQTWPAALGQGMALAIYVDIRRRTPWLDDVGGIDAIACLVGAAVFIAISAASRGQQRGASTARAAELYAVTLPVIAAGLGGSAGGRAVICLVAGGLYAVLSRTRRNARYELLCGVALVGATMLALAAQGADDLALYLMPVAFVGTFLGRRHRQAFGGLGRYLAVWCHVPLYCASAWTALSTKTFGTFALGIVLVTIGVGYAIKVKDRRSLYAAASAAAVLVVGRLVLLGLDNALLGTLLLAVTGIGVLAAMTVFTIRRDAATDVVKSAARGLDDWD